MQDDDLVRLASIAFVLMSSWAAVSAALSVTSGRQLFSAAHVVSWIIWFFHAVPAMAIMIFGTPNYAYSPFRDAAQDLTVGLLYYGFMIGVTFTIHFYTIRTKRCAPLDVTPQQTEALKWASLACLAIAFCLIVIKSNIWLYADYGAFSSATPNTTIDSELREIHGFVIVLSVLSVVFIGVWAILLQHHHALAGYWTTLCAVMIVASWIHGKRTLVALSLVFFLIVFTRALKTSLVVRALMAAVIAAGFFAYSSWYQQQRGLHDVSTYESHLINYSREHSVRMAIHAELRGTPILEWRGQSFVSMATLPVPRSIWESKPWPYAVYATCHALGVNPPRSLGWGLTTSILEEVIANTGWIGLLLGPISLIMLCAMVDRHPMLFVRWLGAICIGLLLVVQFSAFALLHVLYIALAVITSRQNAQHSMTAKTAQVDSRV